jgi:hypothetical protein
VAGFILVLGIACLFIFRVSSKGRRLVPVLFAVLIAGLAAYLLPQFFPTQTAVVLQPGTVTIERYGGRPVVIRAGDIPRTTAGRW